MPRRQQTYGKKSNDSFSQCLAGSSSPLRNPSVPSSPLSSPPQSPQRRPQRVATVICSDDEDEDEDREVEESEETEQRDSPEIASKLSKLTVTDEPVNDLSVLDQTMTPPSSNTRSRVPLQPRDSNAPLKCVKASGSKDPSKPVHASMKSLKPSSLDEPLSEESPDVSPHSPGARRKRHIDHRKDKKRRSSSKHTPSHRRLSATPASSPLKSPTFATRSQSASLTFSVRPYKQRQHIASLPLPDPQDAYTAPLLRIVADPTGRVEPTPFQDWSNDLAAYFEIVKLAEASYGEVYRLNVLPSTNQKVHLKKTQESVLKLIALKPPPEAQETASKKEKERLEGMSKVEDVAGEVRLLQRMTPVPGFTNFREIRVMRGRLPSQFIDAWHVYDREVRRSEFPDPSLKSTYSEDQLWAVIEMQDAGRDLEPDDDGNAKVGTVFAVWDAFWSIACAVSKGEEWAGFEHRDLHLGNVCIKSGDGEWGDWDNWPSVDRLKRKLNFTGLETTIIDYTLSRADMGTSTPTEDDDEPSFTPDSPIRTRSQRSPPSPPASTTLPSPPVDALDPDDAIAFLNLSADPSLFAGDEADDYQYEIYRLMRNAVFTGCPLTTPPTPPAPRGRPSKAHRAAAAARATTERLAWRAPHPLTNLVWLHFVLYKLCAGVAAWPSEVPLGPRAAPAQRAVHGRARELEAMLTTLEAVLELESLSRMAADGGIGSARELVGWAVGEGWLDAGDVLAVGMPAGASGTVDDVTDAVGALHV